MGSVMSAIVSVGVLLLLRTFFEYRRVRQSVGNHPGRCYIGNPMSLLATLFPRIKHINPGSQNAFLDKHNTYAEIGWDVQAMVSILPSVGVKLLLGDAEAIKEVTANRARDPKPVEKWEYQLISFFAPNIIITEGDQWKRFRKVAASAFSELNNKLVFESTVDIVNQLVVDVWGDSDRVLIDHCLDITVPITLRVITSSGFGKQITWNDSTTGAMDSRHTLTFKEALHIASTDVAIKAIFPNWALGMTSRLRSVRDGFEDLRARIKEIIEERRMHGRSGRSDLLSNLLEANGDDGNLTEDDLISNVYIFLLAGYETTAHTLGFALALLALYPDKQETLHSEIRSVLSDGRSPTYTDLPSLRYALATLYETLRMFPPNANGPPGDWFPQCRSRRHLPNDHQQSRGESKNSSPERHRNQYLSSRSAL